MNKNIEILTHNLPDYITGDLYDDELRKEIADQINSDPVFRAEYEDMKNAFTFLGDTSFSEPPGFYFNNLLPNINSKIDAMETKPDSIFSGWFANVLKFAIPTLILVLGYFLYTQFTGTENREVITEDKHEVIEENKSVPENNDPVTNNEQPVNNEMENNVISHQENPDDRNNNIPVKKAYSVNEQNGGSENINFTAGNTDELDELLYDNASFPVASDDIEEQAEELSLQEQDELLNYMANAQL
jgi:hypothetical protein